MTPTRIVITFRICSRHLCRLVCRGITGRVQDGGVLCGLVHFESQARERGEEAVHVVGQGGQPQLVHHVAAAHKLDHQGQPVKRGGRGARFRCEKACEPMCEGRAWKRLCKEGAWKAETCIEKRKTGLQDVCYVPFLQTATGSDFSEAFSLTKAADGRLPLESSVGVKSTCAPSLDQSDGIAIGQTTGRLQKLHNLRAVNSLDLRG